MPVILAPPRTVSAVDAVPVFAMVVTPVTFKSPDVFHEGAPELNASGLTVPVAASVRFVEPPSRTP